MPHLFGVLPLIEALELHLDVRGGFVVLVRSCVLGEANCERRAGDLLFEEVLLVEEQNDGSVREPLVVADGVEEPHRLDHSVHLVIFGKDQVIPYRNSPE